MAGPYIEPFCAREAALRRFALPGFPRGMLSRTLSVDADNGACSLSVRWPALFQFPIGRVYACVMRNPSPLARKLHTDPYTQRGPRYVFIYTVIRDWIYQGRFKPGAQLPTEDELCKLFSVSRITTRKALALLEQERLVRRHPGRGTFVTDDLADAPIEGDMEQLLRKVRRLGTKTRIRDARVEVVTADAETAKDLRLAASATVQRASHVRLLDGVPIGYVETLIPTELSIKFDPRELNENPMLTLLERKGVDISSADQLIGAVSADAQLAQLLETEVGAPLVRIRLVVFDADQCPVERLIAYYRGDHYDHHIRLTRKAARLR